MKPLLLKCCFGVGLFFLVCADVYGGYDPEVGRWLNRDPIGEEGGLNLYAYVLNNPVKWFDPLGLEVNATFDRTTGQFWVWDVDTGATTGGFFYSGGNPWGDPIPTGQYEILDHPNRDFFRLEPMDQPFGDDTQNVTGRNKFRLHKPGRSIGCVTAKDRKDWETIRDLIRGTKYYGTAVDSKSHNPFGSKDEPIKGFGTLTVY